MAERYYCQNRRRRQLVREHPELNGIDYLEVISDDQRTLLVRLLKPLPEEIPFEVRIEGGVRVNKVQVRWRARADHPPEGVSLDTVEAPETALIVQTNVAGDFSPYRLRLVSPPGDDPPAGFDPVLTEIEFSFKVTCPTPFDCRKESRCPPWREKTPEIDYLAKDYASFRRLLLDRLALLLPDWRERSPADLGVALVELLAYAGDYLSYYQDAVATEAYLDTARQRVSLRRHARLLDYSMHEGCNARAWVAFQVDAGGEGLELPRATRLLTQMPVATVVSESEWERLRAEHRAEVFETLHPLVLRQAHNTIVFHTWGDERCCLPRGATRATLKDTGLRMQPGDVLIFVERLGPDTGRPEDADPDHRHAIRLRNVEKGRDPLFDENVIEIEWHAEDALPFPLCLSTVVEDRVVEDVSVALGNVALADHGLRRTETLPPPKGHLRHRPRLSHAVLTFREPYDHEAVKTRPAKGALYQNPRRALPEITLHDEREVWKPVRDLLQSDRFAPEFVVEMENDGRARLRFGDGFHGRRPPAVPLAVEYRTGNGRAGNVGSGAIAHVVGNFEGIEAVFNPLPAAGGNDPEPLEVVRLDAPQAFRVQERAVTEADWAEVAQRHPEVQRAVARRRWTGSWYTWFIAVDRKGGRPVDPAFEAELRGFLERFRIAGYDLEIEPPRFAPLEIVLTVCVEPTHYRDQVLRMLMEAFSDRDLPDGRRGFFHPDNFTFGQAVDYSAVIATAMAVPGVRWVDGYERSGSRNRFRRWGEAYNQEAEKGKIEIGPLEIGRLANDPNRPEDGRIDFILEGGL
ncbi:MAG TPA: putative baseplate assembly protein [Methylothermaceae bacterium]|nr:putative baseplate assembly protein [Methylothermaceae bacterium]